MATGYVNTRYNMHSSTYKHFQLWYLILQRARERERTTEPVVVPPPPLNTYCACCLFSSVVVVVVFQFVGCPLKHKYIWKLPLCTQQHTLVCDIRQFAALESHNAIRIQLNVLLRGPHQFVIGLKSPFHFTLFFSVFSLRDMTQYYPFNTELVFHQYPHNVILYFDFLVNILTLLYTTSNWHESDSATTVGNLLFCIQLCSCDKNCWLTSPNKQNLARRKAIRGF